MLKTLRTFLTIPPVDQRPAVGQWWGLKIFPAYRPKTEWDDVYIYAQLAITTTLTGVILGAIAIAMYTKGYALEWVLETNRTGMWSATNYKSTAVAYLHVYCIIYRQIIAFILIPFFLLKIVINIDFKKYDTFAWLYAVQMDPNHSRAKLVRNLWLTIPFFYFMTHAMHFGQTRLQLKDDSAESVLALIGSITFSSRCFSIFAATALAALVLTISSVVKFINK